MNQTAEAERAAAPSQSRLALLAFLVFVVIALVLAWLLNDLRLQLRETAETVNAKLPSILEKTETSAQALAELSEDVRQLRNLAGATGPREDELLTRLSATKFGSEWHVQVAGAEPVPLRQWIISQPDLQPTVP